MKPHPNIKTYFAFIVISLGASISYFWLLPSINALQNQDVLELQKAGSALIAICILHFGLTRHVERKFISGVEFLENVQEEGFLPSVINRISGEAENKVGCDPETLELLRKLNASIPGVLKNAKSAAYQIQAVEVIGLAFGTIQNGFADSIICAITRKAC